MAKWLNYLRPVNLLKGALNTIIRFFGDTLYLHKLLISLALA